MSVLGLIALHVKPEGTISVKVTVPLNPFTAPMVIVDVADVPVVTDAGFDAATLKLGVDVGVVTVTSTFFEWTRAPLVPVIVTV